MDRGIFLAASAASNLMDRQAIVAHNLANVSTAGFKKVFDRMTSVPIEGAARLPGTRSFGVVLTPGIDTRGGALASTGNPMDVALRQDVYLGVEAPGGAEAFTRRGSLMLDDGGVVRLASGQAALGADGGQIAIPAGFVAAVAEDGTVWAHDPANPANRQDMGRLRLVRSSEVVLRPDGFYDAAGAQAVEEGVKALVSGHVEQSNVSAADALASMIEASRLYDLNAKLIGSFASMDQKDSEIVGNWQ